MLNFERLATAPVGVQRRMRLEFDDYIYSASPPRFSISGLVVPSRVDFYSGNFFEQIDSSTPPLAPPLAPPSPPFHRQHRRTPPLPLPPPPPAQRGESDGEASPTDDVTECRLSPTLKRPGKVEGSARGHKRVSFADDAGKKLVEVCTYSDEEADCPDESADRRDHPLRRGTTLNGTKSLFDVCPSLRDAFSSLSVLPVAYRPEFVQPISNFRVVTERLERNGVCLEFARLAVDDRTRMPTLTGKILVKRGGQAARVFLRCTTDGWKSHADVDATGTAGPSVPGFETRSFSVELLCLCRKASAPRHPGSVEFAVCYRQSSGHQLWDNNDGANYKFTRQLT